MLIAVLTACGGSSSEPNDPGSEPVVDPSDPSEGTSWTVEGTEPPPFDAEALGEGLDGAILTLLALDARPALEAYAEVMAYRTPACPYSYYDSSSSSSVADSWYSQCETAGASTFSGYAELYVNTAYEGYSDRYLYASATVLTADGTTWSASGGWGLSEGDYGNYRSTYQELDGVYAYDGPAAAGTWIEEALQARIVTDRSTARDGRWTTLEVDGQVTGLAGSIDTVDFEDVALDSSDGCDEPKGTIAIRTPDGDWFDVAFSGDGSRAGCDGCGTARWRGLEMGEICADFGPWSEP